MSETEKQEISIRQIIVCTALCFGFYCFVMWNFNRGSRTALLPTIATTFELSEKELSESVDRLKAMRVPDTVVGYALVNGGGPPYQTTLHEFQMPDSRDSAAILRKLRNRGKLIGIYTVLHLEGWVWSGFSYSSYPVLLFRK